MTSPTGSGKSVVQKALAFSYAREGERTIIAVPEMTIGSSFGTDPVSFELPDGTTMSWEVPDDNILLGEGSGVIQKLIAFVEGQRGTVGTRVLICTHAALVHAHKRLVRKHKDKAWAGVNLFLDEGHHAKHTEMLEEDEDLDCDRSEEDEARCNELGRLVEHYLRHQPGRLLMTTATWLRGDAQAIVAPAQLPTFTVFEHRADEYLRRMKHLRTLGFKFMLADEYVEAFRAAIASNPTKRTIVYLPPVQAGEPERKMTLLRECLNVLGPSKPSADGFTRTHMVNGVEVRTMDLVTIAGRERIQAAFAKNKDAPHIIFVQNLFREGADWPQAERALVFGARGSLPMVIQMMGRLLRDYSGKERVEFCMVLQNAANNFETFETYTGAIFMVMALGWLFQSSLVLPPTVRSQRVIRDITQRVTNATMGSGDVPTTDANGVDLPPGEVMRGIIKGAIENLGGDPPSDDDLGAAADSLLACMKGALLLAANACRNVMSVKRAAVLGEAIEANPFTAAREVYQIPFGADNIEFFRGLYATLPKLTPQYVNQCHLVHIWKGLKKEGTLSDPRATVKFFPNPVWDSREQMEAFLRREGL